MFVSKDISNPMGTGRASIMMIDICLNGWVSISAFFFGHFEHLILRVIPAFFITRRLRASATRCASSLFMVWITETYFPAIRPPLTLNLSIFSDFLTLNRCVTISTPSKKTFYFTCDSKRRSVTLRDKRFGFLTEPNVPSLLFFVLFCHFRIREDLPSLDDRWQVFYIHLWEQVLLQGR